MRPLPFCVVLLASAQLSDSNAASSFDGSIEIQHRQFIESVQDQVNGQSSLALNLDYFKDWNKGDDRLEIETFARLDEVDSERTHLDVRQFLWTHYGKDYEFSAGLGRTFWGVTETQHLVDIVNQTDFVENIDGEDKLGQPMLRYQRFTNIGSFEAFLLPYFRERTFEGKDGRLGFGADIDSELATYESGRGEKHVDYALRFSHSFGLFDVGLSWFDGTSREPDLFRNFNVLEGRTAAHYPQINQLGADVQFTNNGWLLKLEAIQRNFSDPFFEDFAALTLGAEYTLVGLFGSNYDLGLLSEYSWDERDERAVSIFQNDLFVGARLVLNDIAGSELLMGVSDDLDFSGSNTFLIEGSTRINNEFSIRLEARLFDAETTQDPLFAFKDNSFVQLGLEYFFD